MSSDGSKDNAQEGGLLAGSAGARSVRPVNELLAAMASVISRGDADAAARLAEVSEAEHPSEPALATSLAQCKSIATRGQSLVELLVEMRGEFENDRYTDAIGHYRQALGLSRDLPMLKASVDDAVIQELDQLLPHNWRIADVMLQEASATEPALTVTKDLRARLEQAQKRESVGRLIHQTDRLAAEGKADEARKELADLLAAHPDDKRIQERLTRLETPAEALTTTLGQAVAEAAAASAQESVAAQPAENVKPKGWRARIAIRASTWNGLKNFGTLAASTAMLGAAGYLVWFHFAKHTPRPQPAANVQKKARPSEEQAWELVKSSDDADSIRSFLIRYPASSHAIRAKVKLAAVIWEKVDKTSAEDLGDYVRAFPDSPYRAEAERLLNSTRQRQ